MELTDLLDKNKKIVENHIKKFFISFFICTFVLAYNNFKHIYKYETEKVHLKRAGTSYSVVQHSGRYA